MQVLLVLAPHWQLRPEIVAGRQWGMEAGEGRRGGAGTRYGKPGCQ